jgi:WD40 repeat protein
MAFSQDAEEYLPLARVYNSLICGTNSLISIFSVSSPGVPHTSISTTKLLPPTKAIISALTVSSDNMLAVGMYNNAISLFSSSYQHTTTFHTSEGAGITQLNWSPDSRYLYVMSRQSTNIEVWDIRSTGRVVGILNGRQASTNQRVWADLNADGEWIVSGGTDGKVKGWKTNDLSEKMEPSFEFTAHNGILCLILM